MTTRRDAPESYQKHILHRENPRYHNRGSDHDTQYEGCATDSPQANSLSWQCK